MLELGLLTDEYFDKFCDLASVDKLARDGWVLIKCRSFLGEYFDDVRFLLCLKENKG